MKKDRDAAWDELILRHLDEEAFIMNPKLENALKRTIYDPEAQREAGRISRRGLTIALALTALGCAVALALSVAPPPSDIANGYEDVMVAGQAVVTGTGDVTGSTDSIVLPDGAVDDLTTATPGVTPTAAPAVLPTPRITPVGYPFIMPTSSPNGTATLDPADAVMLDTTYPLTIVNTFDRLAYDATDISYAGRRLSYCVTFTNLRQDTLCLRWQPLPDNMLVDIRAAVTPPEMIVLSPGESVTAQAIYYLEQVQEDAKLGELMELPDRDGLYGEAELKSPDEVGYAAQQARFMQAYEESKMIVAGGKLVLPDGVENPYDTIYALYQSKGLPNGRERAINSVTLEYQEKPVMLESGMPVLAETDAAGVPMRLLYIEAGEHDVYAVVDFLFPDENARQRFADDRTIMGVRAQMAGGLREGDNSRIFHPLSWDDDEGWHHTYVVTLHSTAPIEAGDVVELKQIMNSDAPSAVLRWEAEIMEAVTKKP